MVVELYKMIKIHMGWLLDTGAKYLIHVHVYPYLDKPFLLDTDAGKNGMG